jgi:hypothetical protein
MGLIGRALQKKLKGTDALTESERKRLFKNIVLMSVDILMKAEYIVKKGANLKKLDEDKKKEIEDVTKSITKIEMNKSE